MDLFGRAQTERRERLEREAIPDATQLGIDTLSKRFASLHPNIQEVRNRLVAKGIEPPVTVTEWQSTPKLFNKHAGKYMPIAKGWRIFSTKYTSHSEPSYGSFGSSTISHFSIIMLENGELVQSDGYGEIEDTKASNGPVWNIRAGELPQLVCTSPTAAIEFSILYKYNRADEAMASMLPHQNHRGHFSDSVLRTAAFTQYFEQQLVDFIQENRLIDTTTR